MNDWNVGLMAHLGMRFVEVGPDKVVAELEVRGSSRRWAARCTAAR
jgi:acyl-coenzyme A thioesterase PaaI-like protein